MIIRYETKTSFNVIMNAFIARQTIKPTQMDNGSAYKTMIDSC